MPKYLTTEADLDFPIPNVERLVAQVRTLFDGTQPVTTEAVAKAIGADVRAVRDVLRRAEHARLLEQVPGRGWVPLTD